MSKIVMIWLIWKNKEIFLYKHVWVNDLFKSSFIKYFFILISSADISLFGNLILSSLRWFLQRISLKKQISLNRTLVKHTPPVPYIPLIVNKYEIRNYRSSQSHFWTKSWVQKFAYFKQANYALYEIIMRCCLFSCK